MFSDDIPTSWQFGPFAPDLDPAERRARLRSMRAIARLVAGPRASTLCDGLNASEDDDDMLVFAVVALDCLAALDRRHILRSFAAL